jgi:hypothetical protein
MHVGGLPLMCVRMLNLVFVGRVDSLCAIFTIARSVCLVSNFQATKGARWMPWGSRPKKDVVSDDTPGGAAIKL